MGPKGLLAVVAPELRDLYYKLEVEFAPLTVRTHPHTRPTFQLTEKGGERSISPPDVVYVQAFLSRSHSRSPFVAGV